MYRSAKWQRFKVWREGERAVGMGEKLHYALKIIE